jgi:tRNA pseudouridine13 synthase
VARWLARAAGVPPRDVGYAGRKDKVAVTTQWMSVPGLAPESALALEADGVRVLRAVRHPHKLRTGHLAGNRFALVVRGVDDAAFGAAAAALAERVRVGLANRFGEQRFGRDRDNAAAGLALLQGGGRAPDRRAARFLVSALQSAVFNEALRLRALPLDALEAGDVAVVHASGGLFLVEDAAHEQPRAEAFAVSATGPIFGTRALEPTGAPRERERAALAACGVDPDAPLRPPPGLRLRGGRRPIRVRPTEASLERAGADAALLRCVLPAGSYVTVLVDALFGGESR